MTVSGFPGDELAAELHSASATRVEVNVDDKGPPLAWLLRIGWSDADGGEASRGGGNDSEVILAIGNDAQAGTP